MYDHLCETSCLSTLYFLEEMHINSRRRPDANNPLPRCLTRAGFLSLWDLASTGFVIGFSVFRTGMASTGFLIFCGYPEYWFSYRWAFL